MKRLLALFTLLRRLDDLERRVAKLEQQAAAQDEYAERSYNLLQQTNRQPLDRLEAAIKAAVFWRQRMPSA